MGALAVLKRDHQEIKKLFFMFEKIDSHEGKKMGDLFKEIKSAVEFNFEVEEEAFYSVIESDSLEMEIVVMHCLNEHREIRDLLKDLSKRYPFEREFLGEMRLLNDRMRGHMGVEERKLFRKVREMMPAKVLKQVGREMESKREELRFLQQEESAAVAA